MAKFSGRRMEASSKGRKDNHGHDPNDPHWDQAPGDEYHIVGACGEAAVAKLVNRFWWSPDFADRNLGDIGRGLHVRSTVKGHHRLMVHQTDGEGIFVLAIRDSSLRGKRLNARWNIIGFQWSQEARNQMWWSDPSGKGRPAYFVPQEALIPIEVLMANLDDFLTAADLMAVR